MNRMKNKPWLFATEYRAKNSTTKLSFTIDYRRSFEACFRR